DRQEELPSIARCAGAAHGCGSLAAPHDADGVLERHAGRSTMTLDRSTEPENLGVATPEGRHRLHPSPWRHEAAANPATHDRGADTHGVCHLGHAQAVNRAHGREVAR